MVEIRIEVIWRERDRRLWSSDRLATEAGLSRSTLDQWPATGIVRMHRRTAAKIVEAFERTPVGELVDEMLGRAAGGS